MTELIKSCQVINSLNFGGAEHLLVHLSEAMDEVNFTIVSLEGPSSLTETLRETGAEVYHLNEQRRFDPRTLFSLRQFLSGNEFDIIHSHLPYAQTLTRIAARSLSQEAIISTQHNAPSNYHPITRSTERATRRYDDTTIAVSQGVERAFTGKAHEPHVFGDDWCTIYNGIDIQGYRDTVVKAKGEHIREELEIDESTPLFLNVGRYVPVKSQDMLIEAMAESSLSEFALVIVGHGPQEEYIKRKIKQHNLSNRVTITGRVQEVEPYYAAADVFVSSSRMEGLPVTLLEAMASELPVIASNIPGVREVVVEGETGALYPYQDIERLASLLVQFAEKDQTMLGEAGFKRAKSIFDIEVMADAHLNLYRSLLSN